jgi:hypothetical protein
MKRLGVLIATLLALLPSAILAVPVAPDAPGLSVNTCRAYRDMDGTAGTLLVVCEYVIPYASLPTDDADINFIGRLLNGATLVGTNTPYPYNDQGYNYGVMSFYMTAAETLAQTWTDGAGAWAAWPLTGVSVTIQGNPGVFAVIPTNNLGISSGSFSTSSGTDANKTQLGAFVLQEAALLDARWSATLLDEQTGTLNNVGTQYFTLAIPNLRAMTFNIYVLSSDTPLFPTPNPTPGGSGTFAETARDRFDAEPYLTPALDGLGTTLGLPNGSFASILVLIAILVLVGWMGMKHGAGGAWAGFAICLTIVIPLALWTPFLSSQFGFIALAFIGMAAIVKVQREYF